MINLFETILGIFFLSSLIFINLVREFFSKDPLNDIPIDLFMSKNKIHYNLSYFIENNLSLTAESFLYFIEYDRINLFSNYHKLKPSKTKVQYHTLLPIHSNGISKHVLNYRELLSFTNVNIVHFTSFLNHGDKHENEKKKFLIQSKNNNTKIEGNRKNHFTLIYLITIGKPTKQIINQIKALSHPEVCFIIFFDNKSNRKEFYQLFDKKKNDRKFENVYFVDSPRFVVSWAQITQALTQVVLNEAALKFFPNSMYLSFHSESDYPIVPNDIIIQYLKENYPNNYMITFEDRKKKAYRKNLFFLFFNHFVSKKILNVLYKLFPQKVIPIAEWRCGWNWFTITLNDSRKMIDAMFNKFELIDTLDYVSYADEIIFNTLAAEANVSIRNKYLRFIDWTGCCAHPLVLNETNFEKIIQSKCAFWARKFKADESKKLMKMIDNYIIKMSKKNVSFFCDES